MESVTFIFTGTSTQAWTPTGDVSLVAVGSYGETAAVSWDPAVTIQSFIGALADSMDKNVIAFSIANGMQNLPAPVPISAGRSIFVASSAKGALTLYYIIS